jgi:hypothetical protein
LFRGGVPTEDKVALQMTLEPHPAPNDLETVLSDKLGNALTTLVVLSDIDWNLSDCWVGECPLCASKDLQSEPRHIDLDVVRNWSSVAPNEVVDRAELNRPSRGVNLLVGLT